MHNKKHRVFVSHSTQDSQIVGKVIAQLEKDNFVVHSSRVIREGSDFREIIKEQIAYSHILLLVLTETAAMSPWVNQEVGIGLALHVPILVVKCPTGENQRSGFLSTFQALEIRSDDESDEIDSSKISNAINSVIKAPLSNFLPHYAMLKSYEIRAEAIAKWANEISSIGGKHHIRQYGELSAFSFPDHLQHKLWEHWGNGHAADKQIEETKALQAHARQAGCSLVLHPYSYLEREGEEKTAMRIELLVKFLRSIPSRLEKKVRVVIEDGTCSRNELFIGDYLFAESHNRQQSVGFLHTFCTRHAATVANRLEAFEILINSKSSVLARTAALDKLERLFQFD